MASAELISKAADVWAAYLELAPQDQTMHAFARWCRLSVTLSDADALAAVALGVKRHQRAAIEVDKINK